MQIATIGRAAGEYVRLLILKDWVEIEVIEQGLMMKQINGCKSTSAFLWMRQQLYVYSATSPALIEAFTGVEWFFCRPVLHG